MKNKIKVSCDDGCASDFRLAELCKKYDIELIFYWPVEWRSLAYSKLYEPLDTLTATSLAKDFEIGSHTITHRHLTELTYEEAEEEIAMSKIMLEKMFNTEVTKFAPPRGYTNEALSELTLEIYQSQRLTKGEGLVHIHPDSGANGNKDWLDCVSGDTKELWCHSWELNKYDQWAKLEDFLKGIS